MSETNNFLIQEHKTPHPHYDLYLQIGPDFKSWIIPSGIPSEIKEKKVAVENDIPNEAIESLNFNDNFEDAYGAGKSLQWDSGQCTFETIKNIKIIIDAAGSKLNGKYLLHVPNWGRWTKKRLWTIEKIN